MIKHLINAIDYYKICKKDFEENTICAGFPHPRLSEKVDIAAQDLQWIFHDLVSEIVQKKLDSLEGDNNDY